MRSMLFQVGTLALVGGLALPAVANSASDSPSSVQTETEIYQDVFAPDSGSIQIEKADGSRRSAVKKVKAICAKVKATEEQKDAIRGEVLAYRENAIPIEAAEKLARLKYYKNVIAVDGSMAIAETASSDLVTAKAGLLKANEELGNKVLFGILEQNQREWGLYCMVAIKRLMKKRQLDRD